MLIALGFLLVIPAIGWVLLTERTLPVPQWLRDTLLTRIEAAAPGLDLSMTDMSLRIARDGTARVSLRDLDLDRSDGTPLVSVGSARLGLAPLDMLRGGAGVRDLSLNGGRLIVTRDREGRLSLSFEQASAGGETPNLQEVLAWIDESRADTRFAGLDRITVDALTLRFEDARARRGWTVDGGRVELSRDGDVVSLRGSVALLTGGADVAVLELNATRGADDRTDIGLRFEDVRSTDIATQTPALAFLSALDAPISGAMRTSVGDDGSLADLSATLQIGAGVLQPTPEAAPVPFDAAGVYLTFDPALNRIAFQEISGQGSLGRVSAHGTATLLDLKRGLPEALHAQVVIDTFTTVDSGVFEGEVVLDRGEADVHLQFNPFRLRVGRFLIETDGARAQGKADVRADSRGWSARMDATLPEAETQTVRSLWPVRVAPRTRNWFTQNVEGGQVRDAALSLDWQEGSKPVSYIDFDFSDATVRYARRLPKVSGGAGRFTLAEHRMVVAVEDASIVLPDREPLSMAGSVFTIPNTRIRPGTPAELDLRAAGPLRSVLAYVDSEALNVMTRAGLSDGIAVGDAVVTGRLTLPLKKGVQPDDLEYRFEAQVARVRSDVLVPNRLLEVPRLAVEVTKDRLRLLGQGRLDGVPFDGSFTQPLGQPGSAGTVSADVRLSPEAASAFGIALPPGMLSGQAQGQLDLTLQRGQAPRFRLTSALKGLGATIPAIGWTFRRQDSGRLEVAGRLSRPVQIDTLAVEAGGLRGDGRLSLSQSGTFESLTIPNLRVGSWLNAPVRVRSRGRGAAPAIDLQGGVLDLRRAPFGAGRGGGGSGAGGGSPITLALDRLILSDGITLHGMTGQFSNQGGLEGTFAARVNDAARVEGRLSSSSAGQSVRIASDNAGRLLAAAGLLKNARGGAMDLTLTPTGAPGVYDGALNATNIRVTDAPFIGSLLDAISIVGLVDQLEGPGIYFGAADATFRLTPTQVILQEAVASGPSMSVTLDGYYDLATKALDMQGVLSPIYVVNAIGQLFSRRGQGLIGFTFTVQGSADAPRVAVNPLSALTPGMFREIFRRAPPKLSE